MYLIIRQEPHPFISQPHGPTTWLKNVENIIIIPLPPPPPPPRIYTCDHHIYQKRQKDETNLPEKTARVRACVSDPIILIGTKRIYMCLLGGTFTEQAVPPPGTYIHTSYI